MFVNTLEGKEHKEAGKLGGGGEALSRERPSLWDPVKAFTSSEAGILQQ